MVQVCPSLPFRTCRLQSDSIILALFLFFLESMSGTVMGPDEGGCEDAWEKWSCSPPEDDAAGHNPGEHFESL